MSRIIPSDRFQSITEQMDWIAEHGGTLAGYIARYGATENPAHYGDGGVCIYVADCAELGRRVEHAMGRGWQGGHGGYVRGENRFMPVPRRVA